MLAARTAHGHVHIHTVSHSAQPDVLQRREDWPCPLPFQQASARTLQHPRPPSLTSNLMAFSSGFRGARSVLGGWGGGRKRKPGSVKPAAPSPQALRFPGTHPWEPRTTYSGRRHRSCSGSCSIHCGARKRAVSQAAHTRPPQAPRPSLGGLRLRALGQPSFLLAGPTCPLTLLSTARSPSWKDRLRYHTDVRCRPRMVTWEPLWRKAGVGSGCSEAGALAPRRPG